MPALALALTMVLGGCTFQLPKDLFPLESLTACPDWSLPELAAEAANFDQATDSHTLECALASLRSALPAEIHKTIVGTHVCYLLADRAERDADQQRLAAEGVRWAEIALENATVDEGPVRYYLATNLGLAVRNHMTLALKNVKRLEQELKVAVKLNPGIERGGPLRVLGLLYLVAPPWPKGIGDGDKALALLRRSVQEYPDHPLNHFLFAQALWQVEEEDAEQEVHVQLNLGNRLLEQGAWGDGAKARWRKMLAELADEAGVELLPLDSHSAPAPAPPPGGP